MEDMSNDKADRSFVSFFLVLQNLTEFVDKLVDVFGDVVAAGRMILGEVVGVLPLVDVIVSISVVHVAVVVVNSLSDLYVSESDASAESTEVVNCDIISAEKVEHLISIRVLNVEDFFLGDARIVGTVADRS